MGARCWIGLSVVVVVATTGCVAATGDEHVGASVEEASGSAPGLARKVRREAAEHGIVPLDPPPAIRTELVELGRALAFDKELSGNRDISCMTCHQPTLGLGDARHLSIGQGATGAGAERVHPDGAFIPRNAPPLFNLHLVSTMFWDGRVEETAHGIETPAGAHITPEMEAVFEFGAASAQPMFPVVSRIEMRGDPGENELADIADGDFTAIWAALMARLGAIPAYVAMFEAAYPGTDFENMTFAHAANAIAAFEIDAFAMVDTPFDRLLAGDDAALTHRQLKGADFFLNQGNCVACHTGPALSDMQFHATAIPQIGPGVGHGKSGTDDFGRMGVTGDPADRYAFRTPPIRNAALTGPWGHAGQFVSLGDYGFHYVDPVAALVDYDETQLEPALRGTVQPNEDDLLSVLDPAMDPPTLNAEKMADIAAFVGALTDPAALDLAHVVPASVPSGLPVSDDAPPPITVTPDHL